ncbi:PH domain-containing protein [Halostella sp. JP-L12]|uniref:PH domain-containing protein n=1 Tax=Halostella TaxID=1843185 RepID=UPI000EF798B0|nr:MULTISPECIES: PH domain-containing protein [Halostella]NHN48520.1 PH domain-containing protein [Halostella sp. JP-L12]
MKLHPISVPYRAVSRGVTFASTLFFVGVVASGALDAVDAAATVPLLIGGFLAGGAYEVAYYRRFEYDLTPDTFDIRSGVLGRREREIPLHRIQNVDISQNLLQRALGVAVLTIETAGGGETEASLQYVGYDEAKRLQRDLRQDADRREPEPAKEGATPATGGADREPGAPATTAEWSREESEELLFSIRPHELVLLSVASVNPGALVLSVIFFPYVELVDVSTLVAFIVPGGARPAITLVATRLAALVLGAWLISAAMTLARYYDFTLSRVGDELRYERGLLQRYSGSIPLEKVQTITVTDNPVTRTAGYATLVVETAGYTAGQSGAESAVPLADRERVYSLAQSIESFEDPEFTRPPKRARERYAVRYSLAVGALTATLYALSLAYEGFERWYAAVALLAVVPVAAHVAWRNRGYQTQGEHVLTRVGFWTRTTKVVPYYRLQTVVRSRSLFQRRRTLANLTADTAGSFSLRQRDATAVDIDDEDAARLRELLRDRLQESLRTRRRKLRSAAERRERDSPETGDNPPRDAERDDESPRDVDPDGLPPRDRDDESDESPPN